MSPKQKSAAVLGILLSLVSVLGGQTPKKSEAIPYPNRSVYLPIGIVGSLGFGIFRVQGSYLLDGKKVPSSALFQWQGEGSFYYTHYISGGVSSKIIAGEPIKGATLVDNRYMSFIRAHKQIGPFAAFVGPALGLHHQSFESDSTSSDNKTLDLSEPAFQWGIETGAGFRVTEVVGLTAGCEFEHSLESEWLVRYSGGISLNLQYLWPHLADLTRAFFLMFEYKYAGVNNYARLGRENETMYMLGGAVAF